MMKTPSPFSFAVLKQSTLLALFTILSVRDSATAPFPVEIMVQEARMTNTSPEAFESFGHDVELSRDRAAIAARGRVDLYRRIKGVWENTAILSTGAHETFDSSFGEAIALDGNTLAVIEYQNTYLFRESVEPALNAWNTTDKSTSNGVFYQYRDAFTPQEHTLAATEGWTLRITARIGQNVLGTASCFVDIANSTERFLLFFDLDDDHNLVVSPGGMGPLTLTSDGAGWSRYHVHEVVFDPGSGTADYYFDGVKKNTSPWSPTPITGLNGVRFGNGSSGGRGSMNWHQVEVITTQSKTVLASYNAGTSVSPVPDIDPATQGWAFAPGNAGSSVSQAPILSDPLTLWTLEAAVKGYGLAIDLEGDRLVIGGYDDFGPDRFVRYFEREGTDWKFRQQILQPTPGEGDRFGEAVSLSGDRLAVGDPGRGEAHVYRLENGQWVYEAELQPAEPVDGLGAAIDITGNRVVVGAPIGFGDTAANIAVLFEHNDAQWGEIQRFFPENPSHPGFGSSVAVQGDTVIIGMNRQNPGAHFIYTPNGSGAWILIHTREYLREEEGIPDPVVRDVAIDGVNILIGMQDVEVENGAGYFYRLDYGNAAGLAQYARKQLYFKDAQNAQTYAPHHTAFRYKHLLYREDQGNIRAYFDTIDDFYGTAELDHSRAVESEILKGLAFHPENTALANLLLDIYYDRTVAANLLARPAAEDAEYARFGLSLEAPLPPNGFLIDVEIPLYRAAVDTSRNILDEYFSLLTDDLSLASEPPAGYRIFQANVPSRALEAATTTNSMGETVPVTSDPILFNGYKDLVLLFQILRDHGQFAETLARLLIARNSPGNREEAAALITDAERFLLMHGEALKGMFQTLPAEDDPSGLAHAIRGWEDTLEALTYLEQLLSGGASLLGFSDDFMMFVQKFTGQTELFDSYDALRVQLNPANSDNPLGTAITALQTALDSYDDYRGFEDQLGQQFLHSSITYGDRLRDIVGVFPDNPDYTDKPTAFPGSELDQQHRSVQLARLQIKRNQVEIQNVNREIEIELAKAASISNVMVDFGGRQASLTREISYWNAAQASANALADALSPDKLLTGRIFGYLLNSVVQGGAEAMKGDLEARKEELAALEQATITGIESDAAVKTLALRFHTLAVDSQQAAVLLQQEMNRLAGLYREKADLEQKLAEQDAAIASRYFADPIHRIGLLNEMLEANLTFNEARKWLFFMARALEYKWNTRFRNFEYPAGSGKLWSTETLYKLRNADELGRMWKAMDTYESQRQLPRDDYFDWFSMRDDFFGYRLTNDLGQPAVYADPITGDPVDGLTAFRSRLRQLQDTQGNIPIRFSTVREVPGGTFFRGPRFGSDGQIISKGLFLDKIKWIKINLPGNHPGPRTQVSGELRYGGTSFIRNSEVGNFRPDRPDRLQNELTSYSTRYWYLPGPDQPWRFTEALSSTVTMQLSADPRTPPTVQEIEVFKERSVATSEWVLTIFTRDIGQTVLNIDQLEDVELYFYHYAVTRP